jgi:hypothetical protein
MGFEELQVLLPDYNEGLGKWSKATILSKGAVYGPALPCPGFSTLVVLFLLEYHHMRILAPLIHPDITTVASTK